MGRRPPGTGPAPSAPVVPGQCLPPGADRSCSDAGPRPGGVIRVLPALPFEWPDGSAWGVRCRGGWTVDLAWRQGELTTLTVRNELRDGTTRTARIRRGGTTAELTLAGGEEVRLGPSLDVGDRTAQR